MTSFLFFYTVTKINDILQSFLPVFGSTSIFVSSKSASKDLAKVDNTY
jgi:hypothetical protein